MRIDDEVLAVLTALVVVASVFSAAMVIPRHPEGFTAIGLLNKNCMIGEYPRHIYVGENVTLCVFMYNYMGRPLLLQARMKLGSRGRIPSNTTPLDTPIILNVTRILPDKGNYTGRVSFTLNETGSNIAIVFELWRYDSSLKEWVYTGRWVHLYVNVTRLLPG